MSLLKQLQAAIADGSIPKVGKPRKAATRKPTNPNIARKYIAGNALPDRKGEPHGFIPAPPPKHLGKYEDKRIIMHGKFVLPVMAHYMVEELDAATYHPFDFIGVSPVWAQHLHLTR